MWCWPWLVWASDLEVLERLRSTRPAAEAITCDGDDADWVAIPQVGLPTGPLRRVALAPVRDRLNVLVEVSPEARHEKLVIGVDLVGNQAVETAWRTSGATLLRAPVTKEGPQGWMPAAGAFAWSGDRLELCLPLSALGDDDPAAHPWVRVRATLVDSHDALAAASYRYLDPPGPLDPPPIRPEERRVRGRLPLHGTWYISQGAMAGVTHGASWAWDLSVRDDAHKAHMGPTAAEALAFGQPLFSPGRGTVRKVSEDNPDKEFGVKASTPANRVVIDLDDRTRISMGHLQHASVPVHADQRVHAGQLVGRVGNSGKSSGPHTHLTWSGSGGEPGPVVLEEVIVRLNPSDDDPWARRLDTWEPHAGYFVEQVWTNGQPESLGLEELR